MRGTTRYRYWNVAAGQTDVEIKKPSFARRQIVDWSFFARKFKKSQADSLIIIDYYCYCYYYYFYEGVVEQHAIESLHHQDGQTLKQKSRLPLVARLLLLLDYYYYYYY